MCICFHYFLHKCSLCVFDARTRKWCYAPFTVLLHISYTKKIWTKFATFISALSLPCSSPQLRKYNSLEYPPDWLHLFDLSLMSEKMVSSVWRVFVPFLCTLLRGNNFFICGRNYFFDASPLVQIVLVLMLKMMMLKFMGRCKISIIVINRHNSWLELSCTVTLDSGSSSKNKKVPLVELIDPAIRSSPGSSSPFSLSWNFFITRVVSFYHLSIQINDRV